MNILLYDCLRAFITPDVERTLVELGHKVKSIEHKISDYYDDSSVMSELDRELTENKFDIVMTINFFPVVARCLESQYEHTDI